MHFPKSPKRSLGRRVTVRLALARDLRSLSPSLLSLWSPSLLGTWNKMWDQHLQPGEAVGGGLCPGSRGGWQLALRRPPRVPSRRNWTPREPQRRQLPPWPGLAPRKGSEVATNGAATQEQTGHKHRKTRSSRSPGRAVWLTRFFSLTLLILSAKGHELQEELFLRYLLSPTSSNDFPTSGRWVQEDFCCSTVVKSPCFCSHPASRGRCR